MKLEVKGVEHFHCLWVNTRTCFVEICCRHTMMYPAQVRFFCWYCLLPLQYNYLCTTTCVFLVTGQKYVIPVSGFFCKLCHRFYNSENAAKISHCQSQAHYDKFQVRSHIFLDVRLIIYVSCYVYICKDDVEMLNAFCFILNTWR